MSYQYGLDQRPAMGHLLLFSLQWLAVVLPSIVIIGAVAGGLHDGGASGSIQYLQRLSLLAGCVMCCQSVWGHRLPLVVGPSSVLLVAMVANATAAREAVHGAIMVSGLLLALASGSGLVHRLQHYFTRRVTATVLLLVAGTLAPTILSLVRQSHSTAGSHVGPLTALSLLVLLEMGRRLLNGTGRSLLMVCALLGGTAAWRLLANEPAPVTAKLPLFSALPGLMAFRVSLDPGVILSFLVCTVAVAVNDIGSIQSVIELLKPGDRKGRLQRGLVCTGLANGAAGLLGVIGTVNYSLSPGLIISSGCASRYPIIPAAVVLMVAAWSPRTIALLGVVPPVVVGGVLAHILSAQVAAGLMLARSGPQRFSPADLLVVGLPLLLGTTVAFLPSAATASLPPLLRPVVGNGFVLGVLLSLVLEQLVSALHRRAHAAR